MESESALVVAPARLAEVIAAIEAAGSFALDLEFVSEDRYIPELALVQVAWGDPAAPTVAAVDPQAVDVTALVALVGRPDLAVIAHAARQDLGLLATRFGVTAHNLWDTQLACAFAGMAEQLGYARMVADLGGPSLDKASQYTDWARRPLSDKQLAYALDDVRYLLGCWTKLAAKLEKAGRMSWLREESERLAAISATRRTPEDAWQNVGGAASLKGAQLGALAGLAAWREREAVATNTPPSWLLPDPAMLDLARRPPRTARDLGRVRAVPRESAEKHAEAIVAAATSGAANPPGQAAARGLGPKAQAWSPLVGALAHAAATEQGLPPRMVATRADIEELCAWFESGAAEPGDVALLSGWRRTVAGDAVHGFLRGERSVIADRASASGLRLVPR
jgi:ribonuclease D